jgi:competence protein ComEC
MKKKWRFVFAALSCAFVALFVVFSQTTHLFAIGETTYIRSCAKIVFGTTLGGTGSNSSFVYDATGVDIASLSIPNTGDSVTQQKPANDVNYALKIGTGSAGGTLRITFSKSYVIQSVYAYATGLSGTKSSTVIKVASEANSTGATLSLTSKMTSPNTDALSSSDGTIYFFDGLDNGTKASSSWVEIGNNGGVDTNNFYLVQLSFRLAVISSGSASSSSAVSSIVSSATSSTQSSLPSTDPGTTPITFNFISQNNSNTGDCTYIKAGDADILIDAGNRTGSAATIESYLEDSSRVGNYVSDKKLEYVIATHAHQDHIAGFVGNSSTSEAGGKDGILYHYSIGTLIDFAQTNATSTIYSNYQTARTYAINQGAQHFTALECWNNASAGAQQVYTLGTNLTMKVLYNYYYDHTSSDENNYSVCLLFTQGSKNFLFTGDLEASGESYLVENNTLPTVELFKGGHHGSYTANTDALLSVIQPKMVCICCCAGNNEYAKTLDHAFPAQESINRIAPYTDRVYVTDLGSWTDRSYVEAMNGNIVVVYDKNSIETLAFSHNDTKLKDTTWFKANRSVPSAWSA